MPEKYVKYQEKTGDRLFKVRDYKGALERFDKALEPGQVSQDLHYRIHNKKAAAFIKLQKYGDARDAAAQAIRLAPEHPDGYLYVSQALQLRCEIRRASEILEAGLKRMKAESAEWKKIEKHLDDVKARLIRHEKRVDFLNPEKIKFPLELAWKIFEHLLPGEHRDVADPPDLCDLLVCKRVSKRWNEVVSSNPKFYQNLHIWREIPTKVLNRWLNLTENSPYKLHTLSLKLKDTEPCARTSNLYSIAKVCKQLESLRLNINDKITKEIHDLYPAGSNTLTKLVLDGRCPISMTDIQEMVKHLPALEHAEFHGVAKSRSDLVVQWPSLPHLTTIFLCAAEVYGTHESGISETMLGINKLIAGAPNVTHATIRSFGKSRAWGKSLNFGAWKSLQKLDIHYTRVAFLPTFPDTLLYLDVSSISSIENFELLKALNPDGTVNADLFRMPKLETLNVGSSHFTQFLYEMSIEALASGTLKALGMGDTTIYAAHRDPYLTWPVRMPGPSATLATLSLKSLNHLSEDMIIEFLKQYPNLDEVELSECDITGTTIRTLFQREHKPRVIFVKKCPRISSDAVEAARRKLIDVDSDHLPQRKQYGGRTAGRLLETFL